MKKIIIITLLTSLFLLSCKKEEEISSKKYFKTTIVQTGNIIDSESYIGYTDSFNHVSLAPKIGGKIVSISKNVGDKVRAGEVVAVLDSLEAKTGYNSSENIIRQLELLKQSTSESFDKQIQATAEKLKQLQVGIDIAQIQVDGSNIGINDIKNITDEQLKTISTQIKQAEVGLQTAKLNLENTKSLLSQKENDIYNNAKNSISNANILISNIIDFLDNLYGVTEQNKHKNDSFEIYLGAKNTSLKNEAENNLRNIILNYQNLKKLPTDNYENIENTLKDYNNFFSKDVRDILKLTFNVLENSISSSNFSESQINTLKNQTTTLQTNLEQTILTVSGNYFLGLKGSLDSINNFKKESKNTLDMLEKQVELAEKQIDTLNQTYNQYKAQSDGQITEVKIKKDISNKQKELTEKQIKELDLSIEALKKQKESSLKQIDTQIQQVKAGQNDAYVMIENGKVISLINGIVTKKLQEVGNVVGPGMPILIVSQDEKIKIEIGVGEEVFNKIKINDEVKVEIDQVKELKTGIITKILPTRDEITKKNIIEITLNNKDKQIKIGSYSKVYFNLNNNNENEKEEYVIIPNNAIVSKFMIPGVYVLKENKANFRNIKILKMGQNFSKVSGLNVGEIIITEGKENIIDQEILINN